MKTVSLLQSAARVAALLLLVSLPGSLRAQSMGLPLTVDVTYRAELNFISNTYVSSYDEYEASLGSAYPTLSEGWHYAGWSQFPDSTAKLRPGKKYFLSVVDPYGDTSEYRVSFAPVEGYRLFIDGVERYRVDGYDSGGYLEGYYQVHLEPIEPPGSLGVAESIQSGSKVFWRVGMGTGMNGKSAGFLQVRQSDFSSTLFTPAALDYESACPDVSVRKSGASLRQVRTPRGLADIVTVNSSTYEIRFYHEDQVANSSPYDIPSGVPFVKYRIEKYAGSSTKMLITKTVVKNDTETSTKSWTTRVEKHPSGSTSNWYVYDWTESGKSNLRRKRWYVDSSGDQTVYVQTGGGSAITTTREDYESFGGSYELKTETYGYGSVNLATTYDYHTTSALKGKLKSMIRPDSSWTRYDYYTDLDRKRLVSRTYEPYGDGPVYPTQATTTNCKVTTHAYTADWTGMKILPSSIETKVSNVTTAKSTFSYGSMSSPEKISAWGYSGPTALPLLAVTRTDYATSGSSLATVTKSFRPDSGAIDAFFPGLVHSVTNPDGTRVSHAYMKATLNEANKSFTYSSSGVGRIEHIYTGRSTSASGTSLLSTLGSGSAYYDLENLYLVPGVSTRQDIVRDEFGDVCWTAQHTWTGTVWQLISGSATQRDKMGKVTKVEAFYYNGTATPTHVQTYAATYEFGLKKTETDEANAVTDFQVHDAMGRVTQQRQRGYGTAPNNVPDIYTYFEYDAEGRVTATKIGTSSQIVTRSYYDQAGRVTKETAPGHDGASTTAIEVLYTYPSGGRQVRKTFPDNGYSEEAFYRDGRLKSVTGTATVPKYVKYERDATTGIETETTALNSSYTHGWSKKSVDWLGRPLKEEAPTYDGGTSVAEYFYNASGQLNKMTRKNNDGARLYADTLYVYDGMGKLVQEGLDLDASGSLVAASNDRITKYASRTAIISGIAFDELITSTYPNSGSASEVRLSTKYERLSHFSSSHRAESIVYDTHNNYVQNVRYVDTAARTVTMVTYHSATAAGNDDIAKSINGFPTYAKSKEGVETKYEYDAWGRQDKVTGRDSMWTATEYYPGTTLAKRGWDALGDTGFWTYDGSGRVASAKTVDDQSVSRMTYYAYNQRGQQTRQWGNGAQPLEHVYDGYGRREQLKTYRAGSNWHLSTWPSSPGTADTTTWSYQSSTGLLTAKTDAASKATTFTYADHGAVWTKTLARGVTVTYSYFGAGDSDTVSRGTEALKKISYSDSTPEVVYTYYRHGAVKTVADVTGTRTFTYRSSDLQLDQERLPYGFYGGYSSSDQATITRKYDTASGKVGRSTGFQFGRWNDVDQHLDQTYGYDSATGRVSSVAALGRTFNYGYKAKSNRVSSVTHGSFSRLTSWNANRSSVDAIETKWGSTSKAKYEYEIDVLGRIVQQRLRGTLASNSSTSSDAGFAQGYGISTDYQYNNRDELDYADTYLLASASGTATGAAVAGRMEEYNYDNAQNRLWHRLGGLSEPQFHYQANNLNQTRVSDGANATAVYDADGNLTNDKNYVYEYDAENRLIKATNIWNWSLTEYKYDYLGRMVSKTADEIAPGIKGQYWNETNPVGNPIGPQRVDSAIDFDWGTGSPDPSMGADTFYARWYGWLEAPADGTYTIYATSDDGVKVQVDGKMLVDAWYDQGVTPEHSGQIFLRKGVKVPVYMQYYEQTGPAVCELRWSGPGVSKQIISSSYLTTRSTTVRKETRYVYDGWNIVAELDSSNQGSSAFASCPKQKHVWGLDVSSSTQGAGGIGGLLFTRDGSSDYFAIYDGRGNVTGMLNSPLPGFSGAQGQVVAGWQYNAFGEQVAAVGSLKDKFHFGWSTKFTEDGMRLINFGKRWYDSRHGRFINRDPIGERGGINLYAFGANNPLGGYEFLGEFFGLIFGVGLKAFLAKKAYKLYKRYRHTIRTIALWFIPYVGPYLAAAYGAYQGYQTGGLFGAAVGAISGYTAGASIATAKNAVLAIARRLAINEAMSLAVRAVDRKVRGFAKWFGRASGAMTLFSGFTSFSKSVERWKAKQSASVKGSPQLASAAPASGSSGGGSLGPVELIDYDVEDGASRAAAFIEAVNQKWQAVMAPARAAVAAFWRERRQIQQAAFSQAVNTAADVARSTAGPTYTARDSLRAHLRSGEHMNSDAHMRNLAIVGGASAAPVAIYGAAAAAPYVATAGKVGLNLARASRLGPGSWNAYQSAAGGWGSISSSAISSSGWRIYSALGGQGLATGFQAAATGSAWTAGGYTALTGTAGFIEGFLTPFDGNVPFSGNPAFAPYEAANAVGTWAALAGSN